MATTPSEPRPTHTDQIEPPVDAPSSTLPPSKEAPVAEAATTGAAEPFEAVSNVGLV